MAEQKRMEEQAQKLTASQSKSSDMRMYISRF